MIVSIALILAIVFVKPVSDKDTTQDTIPANNQISKDRIRRICELATLECYYHNTTEWKYNGNMLDPSKRLWMEYDGLVRVGINGEQVDVSGPDDNNVVTVTIPKAVILEKDLDESTLASVEAGSRYMGFLPIYSEITSEDRQKALAEAQNKMEEKTSQNHKILAEAQERAKKIIQNSIIKIGEMEGKKYTVVFVDPKE